MMNVFLSFDTSIITTKLIDDVDSRKMAIKYSKLLLSDLLVIIIRNILILAFNY